MKLPVGKISGEEIDRVFNESIDYHIKVFYDTLGQYEQRLLYSHWRSVVRSIDEMINIPMELDEEEDVKTVLGLRFNFMTSVSAGELAEVLEILGKNFNKNIGIRFNQLAFMCSAINVSFVNHGVFDRQGMNLNLSDTRNAIAYLQSRRAYYVTTLNLIPKIAKGEKRIEYIDTLNFLQYTMDTCLVGITTAYYNLLLNHCLPDFEMISDGEIAIRNFDYDNLEGFFMEPERLSMLDQMELRSDAVDRKLMLPLPKGQVFSYSEVANTMSLFEGTFKKYGVSGLTEFQELNLLFVDLGIFLKDDHNIVVPESDFSMIRSKYKSLILYQASQEYFDNLNSYAPFQKLEKTYYSTVVLLVRFTYRTLSQKLLSNKTFQINSGFIFEDKVSSVLEKNGFMPTGITRLNHKEFDLITIKDKKVFNFQCKNNFIDISRVDRNVFKIGRFNRRLCHYYEKALIKEKQREHLIQAATGISSIEHLVVSRYPVITRNPAIINVVDLPKWAADASQSR